MIRSDAAAALLIVAIAIAGCGKQAEQRTTATVSRRYVDSLETELARLRSAPDPSSARALHPISDGELGHLRRRGLTDPISDLVDDLASHPEIIPKKAPPGAAQYGFYDRAGIRVLNKDWVLAPYDDGHDGGYLLLQYEVGASGAIHWQVLQSGMVP